MKIFSRDLAGTVLIWLGILIFIVVIYDYIRPVFPSRPPYDFIQSIQSFFSKKSNSQQKYSSKKISSAPRSHINPPTNDFKNANNLLITSVYRPTHYYQQWIWPLKPEYISGNQVTVEAAHAAKGAEGGFKIIAYADSDGDDKPDKKIAESEFFTGAQQGDWSSFTFVTNEKRIFVGTRWSPSQDTLTFRQNGEWPGNNSPLKGRFFYTIDGNNSRSAGPAFTNLRVTFSAKE